MAPGPGVKAYFAVWLALLLLLVLTFLAGDLLDVGRWNFVIALAIAATKATLIGLFFMHIYYSPPLTRLVAVSGLFFLSILLGLALCDYATRANQSPTGGRPRRACCDKYPPLWSVQGVPTATQVVRM